MEDRPMAKSLNRVELLGYLGTDANIKEITDGTSVWGRYLSRPTIASRTLMANGPSAPSGIRW